MRRALWFRLEAALIRLLLTLLRLLGPVRASNLAGAIARNVGPLLPVSRIADVNLRLAMPDLDAAERRRVIRGMWDNLGRTIGELPHLPRLRATAAGPGWETQDATEVLAALRDAGGPSILISGHIGNWEMLPPIVAAHGVLMSSFYRAPANPLVDRMLTELRRAAIGAPVPMFRKGADGAQAAFAHLRAGGCLGILVDQKLNDGISVPLFGHPAMTAPAAAAFALRFRCPLLFGHIERIGPARFRLVFDARFTLPESGNRQADIAALTAAINQTLENVVRARPDSWLWLHRRWPNERYA